MRPGKKRRSEYNSLQEKTGERKRRKDFSFLFSEILFLALSGLIYKNLKNLLEK
jgi:hypothetical protein